MRNYRVLIIMVFALLTGCRQNATSDPFIIETFYVGTYTDNESEGIYTYALMNDGSLQAIGLAAKTDNPSFLTLSNDQRFLLSVNELEEGRISSFRISGDSLIPINTSSSGGAHPCYIDIDEKGYVATANYTGGSVGLHQLDPQGTLTPLLDLQQFTGKGITDRQEAPHAHMAIFAPFGPLIALDLGTDLVHFMDIDTVQNKLNPTTPDSLKMVAGSGPRHLAFHPTQQWVYVLNELNNTIAFLQLNKDGIYDLVQTIPMLPKDFIEFSKGADIHLSSDGKFLYASNRGHDSIVIYQVARDGTLSLIGHESTGGKHPRNFVLSPNEEYLLVANQDTDNIVSFRRDPDSGKLTYISEIEAPNPVCLLFSYSNGSN